MAIDRAARVVEAGKVRALCWHRRRGRGGDRRKLPAQQVVGSVVVQAGVAEHAPDWFKVVRHWL